ncbi:MAG: toll/interleukin-1 receptor domain-containing protein, partial [Pseudomonadota bacterium]
SGPQPPSARVFVSYSRNDKVFAADLVAGLEACGFDAYIDEADIAPGEPWEARLAGLISQADTVVYVISPDSMASGHCAWEVGETLRLSKRLLPVVWRDVPDAEIPPHLSALNFIFFSGDRSFAQGLNQLAIALRTDVDWVREHSRIAELSRRWEAREKSDALLLRGEELDAARDWEKARPASAPDVTDAQREFIAAGLALRDAAERAARNRRRGVLIAVSSVAVAMAGLAGVAGLQWRDAESAKDFAQQAYRELESTNDQLLSAFMRLNADIGLRAPPTGDEYLNLSPGWFPIAASYSGVVARVERRREDGSPFQVVSGFAIDGALAHPSLAGEPLLLVPRILDGYEEGGDNPFVAPPMELAAEGAVDDPDLGAMSNIGPIARALPVPPPDVPEPEPFEEPPAFPGVEDPADPFPDDEFVPATEFEDAFDVPMDAPPMAQMIIGGAPPVEERGDVYVAFPAVDEETWIKASELIWETPLELMTAPFELWRLETPPPFGARFVSAEEVDCAAFNAKQAEPTKARPLAMYGVGNTLVRGDDAVTLFMSELRDGTNPYQVSYTHSTTLGSAGAPVFDIETGSLLAVHIGSAPDRDTPGRRTGFGIALPIVLNDVRMDLVTGDEDEPMGFLCQGA